MRLDAKSNQAGKVDDLLMYPKRIAGLVGTIERQPLPSEIESLAEARQLYSRLRE